MTDDNLILVDVTIMFDADRPSELEDVTVAIGDGKTVFDENYPMDARVYFYFDDLEHFKRAHLSELEDVGFRIVRVVDEKESALLGFAAAEPKPTRPTDQRIRIGTCAVDSGQIMIVDPCYLDEYVANDFDPDKPASLNEFSYAGACATTLTPLGAGQIRTMTAVVASSGYGDGIYPVYATYDYEGTITKLEIEFVYDDEEEVD